MSIENVYVFVADALRWDYVPSSVANRGKVIKTVACSTLSPTSFASLVSGLYPPQHGVHTFAHQISDKCSYLLNNSNVNSSFWQLQSDDPIYDVLKSNPTNRKRVDEMDSPFINIERELATHAPYGISSTKEPNIEQDAGEFIKSHAGNLTVLEDHYKQGVKRVVEVFEQRLQALEERDLLEETLVIFTSDHGELLGEYASSSHTFPMVPESVYVPTILINPGEEEINVEDVFSHIDIPATIIDVLDLEAPYEFPGISAFNGQLRGSALTSIRFPENTAAFGETDSLLSRFNIAHQGLWDEKGGWVFDESSLIGKLSHGLKNLAPLSRRKCDLICQNPHGYGALLRICFRRRSAFGNPHFDEKEARDTIRRILDEPRMESNEPLGLGEEKIEHLENLGYR